MWKWLMFSVQAVACTHSPPEPSVWLGGGYDRFEPLFDGDAIAVVEGAQGGWHLWESLRVSGLEPDRVTVQTRTEATDGGGPKEVRRRTYDLVALGEPDEAMHTHELLGVPVVLTEPECLIEREVRLEVTVTDGRGRAASDARRVVLTSGDDGGPDPARCMP